MLNFDSFLRCSRYALLGSLAFLSVGLVGGATPAHAQTVPELRCNNQPVPLLPCDLASAFGGQCVFGSLTYTNPNSSGVQWESITAYGYYWNLRVSDKSVVNRGCVAAVPRYVNNGLCLGSDCRFDTRLLSLNSAGEVLESITKGNQFWIFRTSDQQLVNSGTLSGQARYAAGPCLNKGDQCQFDTRGHMTYNSRIYEVITAYEQYWIFDTVTHQRVRTGSLYKRYSEPCFGRSDCKLDSMAFRSEGGKQLEIVTAYGKMWEYEVYSLDSHHTDNPSDLASDSNYTTP